MAHETEQHSNHSVSEASREIGTVIRTVVVVLLLVAVVLVGLDNRRDVRIGYVFGDAQAPIWIVLVAAGVAGVIVGWLLKHRPHRH